jgi:hypothetical protein
LGIIKPLSAVSKNAKLTNKSIKATETVVEAPAECPGKKELISALQNVVNQFLIGVNSLQNILSNLNPQVLSDEELDILIQKSFK